MIDMPFVSIITPAYNAERFISFTIESVQNQTYENWEMLISDDRSEDRTVEIVKSYAIKDERIKLIQANKNGGVSAARNLAIRQASGKYIAFIDSDDCWMPDKLEKQTAFMLSKDIAFSFTSYQMMNENGATLEKYIRSKPVMTYQNVLGNTLIGCLTVMVDVEKTGSFQMPLITHTEDTMTWVEILKRGFKAYGMPDILAFYRLSANSLTAQKIKMAKLQWNTYRRYCKFGIIKSTYYFSSYAINAVMKMKSGKKRISVSTSHNTKCGKK